MHFECFWKWHIVAENQLLLLLNISPHTFILDCWEIAKTQHGLDKTKIVSKECHIQSATGPSKSKINSSARLNFIHVTECYQFGTKRTCLGRVSL